MLLRDAGVAALTACHRISYKEHQQSILAAVGPQQRAQAQACAPTLPGEKPIIASSQILVSFECCLQFDKHVEWTVAQTRTWLQSSFKKTDF